MYFCRVQIMQGNPINFPSAEGNTFYCQVRHKCKNEGTNWVFISKRIKILKKMCIVGSLLSVLLTQYVIFTLITNLVCHTYFDYQLHKLYLLWLPSLWYYDCLFRMWYIDSWFSLRYLLWLLTEYLTLTLIVDEVRNILIANLVCDTSFDCQLTMIANLVVILHCWPSCDTYFDSWLCVQYLLC